MPGRPTPFQLVFGADAKNRFAVLRAGLEAAGRDPRDRDAFLLVREVAELLRELRPEEGLGEAMGGLAALLHHAYLFWCDGERVRAVSEEELAARIAESAVDATHPSSLVDQQPSTYVQLPPFRVWGHPVEGQPPEPLDGWFVSPSADGLTVLAIFGLHPGRAGLTAVEVSGPRPPLLQRQDGSALFAPTMPGGALAGLASVAGEAELLELAWRAEEVL